MQLATVDTLVGHLFVADWLNQYAEFFVYIREIEQLSPYEPMIATFHGVELHTYPARSSTHWHAFKVWLPQVNAGQTVAIELRLYDRPLSASSHQWPIEVVYRSAPCWTVPFATLWETTITTLQRLSKHPDTLDMLSRVSRVDIAIDTDTLSLTEKDRVRFISKARHQAEYMTTYASLEEPDDAFPLDTVHEQAMYHRGDTFTGFTFGKGALMCRVYNKWVEISTNRSYKGDKRFFADLWLEAGWDTTQDVWRIEYQLRREALHQFFAPSSTEQSFADLSIPEVVAQVPSLLPYLLLEWLTYRTPSEAHRPAHWPLDPRWAHLATVADQYGVSERHGLPPQFNAHQLAKSLRGFLCSYAVAVQIPSGEELFAYLSQQLATSLEQNEKDFLEALDGHIAEKARTHGIHLRSNQRKD